MDDDLTDCAQRYAEEGCRHLDMARRVETHLERCHVHVAGDGAVQFVFVGHEVSLELSSVEHRESEWANNSVEDQ